MFSITDTVLFKPLAYHDPGQLASLSLTVPAFANVADRIPLNGSHYRFFQQHSRTLAGIALIGTSNFVLSGSGQAVAVQGVRVMPNFFSLLQEFRRALAAALFRRKARRARIMS